ncbi:MAG: acyl-CoA dehydrogenase family protein [Candidatus Latescibacterota bacterium]
MNLRFTEEQIALKEVAREFFEREVRPVMAELDARPNPRDCYPRELVRKGSELGLRTLALPKEIGGGGVDDITRAFMFETMSSIEPGTAKIFSQCWKVSRMLYQCGTEEQIKKFLTPFIEDHDFVGSMCITEPNSGSDNVLPYKGVDGGITTSAVPDGDYYVINGMKHMVSLASFSKLLIVYCRTDRTIPARRGMTTFLVPGDFPGVSYGQVHNKMGWRLYPNGEIFFDNVRLPKEYMLGKLNDGYANTSESQRGDVEGPTMYLGICKAIYRLCLDHAKQRIQGGKPIIEHPTVGSILSEMAMIIDVLEGWVYDTAYQNTIDQKKVDTKKKQFGRIFSRECGFRMIALGVDILASVGIMREFPMEKLIRDFLSDVHGSASSSLLKLKVLPFLER